MSNVLSVLMVELWKTTDERKTAQSAVKFIILLQLPHFKLLSAKSLQAFQYAFDIEQVNLSLYDVHT